MLVARRSSSNRAKATRLRADSPIGGRRLRAWVEGFLASDSLTHVKPIERVAREAAVNKAADLIREGLEHRKAGRLVQARESYTRASVRSRLAGDLQGAAAALNNIGALCLQQGDLEGAAKAFGEARQTAAGPCVASAHAAANLGLVEKERGRTTEAAACFREALELHERLGNRRGAAQARGNLGLLALARGELDEAEAILEAARSDFLELNDPLGVSVALNAIGDARRSRGDLVNARSAFSESLAISEAAGFSEGRRTALQNLGSIARVMGDLDEAERAFTLALAAAEKASDPKAAAAAHTNLGHVASARGNRAEARAAFEKSRALNAVAESEVGEAADIANIAATRTEDGGLAESIVEFDEAIARFERAGHAREALSTSLLAGQALAMIGRVGEARSRFELVSERATALGLDALVTMAHGSLAAFGIGRQPLVESEAALEAIEETMSRYGDKRGRAIALANLADVACWRGHFPRAFRLAREARAFGAVQSLGSLEADTTVLLGEIAERADALDDAWSHLLEAAELYLAHHSPQGLARSRSAMARVHVRRGEWDEALVAADEACGVWERFPAPASLADLELTRAKAWFGLGLFTAALDASARASSGFDALELRLASALARVTHADCLRALRRPEEAAAERREAARTLRWIGATAELARLGQPAAAPGMAGLDDDVP